MLSSKGGSSAARSVDSISPHELDKRYRGLAELQEAEDLAALAGNLQEPEDLEVVVYNIMDPKLREEYIKQSEDWGEASDFWKEEQAMRMKAKKVDEQLQQAERIWTMRQIKRREQLENAQEYWNAMELGQPKEFKNADELQQEQQFEKEREQLAEEEQKRREARRSMPPITSVVQPPPLIDIDDDDDADVKSDVDYSKPVKVMVRLPSLLKPSSMSAGTLGQPNKPPVKTVVSNKEVRIAAPLKIKSVENMPAEYIAGTEANKVNLKFLSKDNPDVLKLLNRPNVESTPESVKDKDVKPEAEPTTVKVKPDFLSDWKPEPVREGEVDPDIELWKEIQKRLPFIPNVFRYDGPSILFSTSRPNPLGPYGFELETRVPPQVNKNDHVMNISDLEEAACNIVVIREKGEAILTCLNLICRNRFLVNIDVMQNFTHLRYVHLPRNRLTSILVLHKLQELIVIDVGHNLIDRAGAIPVLNKLEAINLTDNPLPDLVKYPGNTMGYACFNYDKLANLEALTESTFTKLKVLEIRGNKLTNLGKLDLPYLQHLYAAENQLTDLSELEKLVSLESFHARSNSYQSLQGFPNTLLKLTYLNLRNNKVDRLTHICQLNRSPVECLIMMDNPVCQTDRYRVEILTSILTLKRLDKSLICDEDMEGAEGLRQGRKIGVIPPVRNEVVSATPPPTPVTERSEVSEGETPVASQRRRSSDNKKTRRLSQKLAPQEKPKMVDASAGLFNDKPQNLKKLSMGKPQSKVEPVPEIHSYRGSLNLLNGKPDDKKDEGRASKDSNEKPLLPKDNQAQKKK